MPTKDIEQLYATRKVTQGKNGTTETFELHGIRRDHSRFKILGGLEKLEQALWLEQEIEGLLGLRDRSVSGEVVG